MNAPHTYGGNVVVLGRVISSARAEHERITAANFSRGPQEAPMAIDVPHIEDEPTEVDRLPGGVFALMLVGYFVVVCIAVAVL